MKEQYLIYFIGKKAPLLVLKEHIESMKPGSVVVDLAAESGGNIETTKPGEIYTYKDVVHIGFTDLPSRLPTQSSTLYANNISKFLLSMEDNKDHFYVNLEDEVVRGSILLDSGKLTWPPPAPKVIPSQVAAKIEAPKKAEPLPRNYFKETLNNSLIYTGGLGFGVVGLGAIAPNAAFSTMCSTFALSGIVG